MSAFAIPGPQELFIIAGVLVLLFGASRLPKLARAAGESIMELKKGLREVEKIGEEEKDDRD